MGEIVNLRRERKRAARRDDASQAQANRVLFGRTKVEKARDALEAERTASYLDRMRLNETSKKE